MLVNNEIPRLSKEKLLLRPFSKEDIGDMCNNWAFEDEHKCSFTESPHIEFEMRLNKIQNILDSYLFNNRFIWVIEYNKKAVGSIEAVNLKNDGTSCEIVYYLSNELHNTSLFNESIKLVNDYLMKVFGVKKIEYKELQTSYLAV